MIRYIQKKIEGTIRDILKKRYQLENYPVPEAQYPDPQMGDLSYTLAFPLAKVLKSNPKTIAEAIIAEFPFHIFPEIERAEIGGNGYLNIWLNRSGIAREIYNTPIVATDTGSTKAIVEHTNINPNKAAHVGHLRNACLGDTLVRLLRFHGFKVEVQNYIDDTGVQLADVVVGFRRKGMSASDLDRIKDRFDYYCWDLYAEAHQWIEESPDHKAIREATLKAMEERAEPEFPLSQAIAERIIRHHLQTAARLGIDYDLLPRESDIIGRRFWQRTFELMEQNGAIVKVEEGKNQGCWIMSLSKTESFEEMQNPDKIIVRSNGTVTYVGKDIAYQLWKFGLLGLDFYYRVFETKPDGSTLWTTSVSPNDRQAPQFGRGDVVYNVIDQRQSYLQKVVAEGLRLLGYQTQAESSIHFAYEMVALSAKTAKELGFDLSVEQEERSFVEMSGRKGVGVKADDLLDRLEQKALERIGPLYEDMPEVQKRRLAAQIACGALRYFMIRFSRNTLITFDLDEALNFEGETGPYLQYSMVRAQSIFRKLQEAGFDVQSRRRHDYLDALLLMEEQRNQESDDSWAMIREIIKTHDVVEKTLRSLEISMFAKYVFQLAQAFNNYYHKYPVLHEPNDRKKLCRVAVLRMFSEAMQLHLDLLGIPVPSRM